MSDAVMSLWTVYYKPKDYPYGYIARRFEIHPGESRPTKSTFMGETLGDIRRLMPPGLVCLARSPDDDPVIVEVWI
jgi:hypothetical protein